jgi:S1-C subfamily serine protease
VKGSNVKELYERYKYCVVQIIVKTVEGDLANGTGFHIGDGYIVTARHVIENNTIESIVGNRYSPEGVTIKRIFYPYFICGKRGF